MKKTNKKTKQWLLREIMKIEKNVVAETLVDRDKILLLPVHIKLGLMKQFINSLSKKRSCFDYLFRKFLVLRMDQLKAIIFDELQIKELMKSPHLQDSMNNSEAAAWSSL